MPLKEKKFFVELGFELLASWLLDWYAITWAILLAQGKVLQVEIIVLRILSSPKKGLFFLSPNWRNGTQRMIMYQGVKSY
jgi:hypothetical protein